MPAGPWGCALSLAISKVPDARRQGVTSEVYKSYSAGRNDRSQRSRWCLDEGSGIVLRIDTSSMDIVSNKGIAYQSKL
ncbi:MAG: hypothetical protein HN978_11370 [Desulfobacula sp.]|nr:hypothetical protein [Desulfobacula sp.]